MKVVVFGATGGVGQQVVRRAATAGHQVTAFLRTPAKLQFREGVAVVQADAFDAPAVAAAIAGQDAVISCLSSSTPMKPSTELTRMTGNIVAGMAATDIDRIAYCASAGVDHELGGVAGKAIEWFLRHPLNDHRQALKLLTAANLNYTIARPMSLNNKPFDPNYREAFTGIPKHGRAISRASVADFLVKALEHPVVYSRTSVGLAEG